MGTQRLHDLRLTCLQIYLSLSTAINEKSPNHKSLIATCHPDRILAESDFHDASECAIRTWRMVIIIAEVKNWRVEDSWEEKEKFESPGVVRRLASNWSSFTKLGPSSHLRGSLRMSLELELDTDEEEQ